MVAAKITSQSEARMTKRRMSRHSRKLTTHKTNSKSAIASGKGAGPQSKRRISLTGSCPVAFPDVGTVTVNEMGFGDEIVVSVPVERTHVAPTGAPVQVIETLPVKPVPELNCRPYCAV